MDMGYLGSKKRSNLTGQVRNMAIEDFSEITVRIHSCHPEVRSLRRSAYRLVWAAQIASAECIGPSTRKERGPQDDNSLVSLNRYGTLQSVK
jgi:hypothetical protein